MRKRSLSDTSGVVDVKYFPDAEISRVEYGVVLPA